MTQPATRPNAYTDDDVKAALAPFWRAQRQGMDTAQAMCAALDAVAPAIAARALREAADAVLDTRGERKWLRDRADEMGAAL